jgi:hypothetical protein
MSTTQSGLHNPRWVQSCITNVSFPQTLEGILQMVDGNFDGVHWHSDIDALQQYDAESGFSWTAPKWLTAGDILFFYHTKNAKERTSSLLRQAQAIFDSEQQNNQFVIPGHEAGYILEPGDMDQLLQLLTRATTFAATFAGSIFGCVEAGGASEYIKDEDDIQHLVVLHR